EVVAVLARQRLAIAAQIRIEEVALRRRLALERSELDAGVVGARRLDLRLIEAVGDLVLARLRQLRIGLKRIEDLLCLRRDLPIEIADLGGELLHARMTRQEGRRELGHLGL